MRAQALADYRAGRTSVPPWNDGWASDEARREYFRNYQRRRRSAKRTTGAVSRITAGESMEHNDVRAAEQEVTPNIFVD